MSNKKREKAAAPSLASRSDRSSFAFWALMAFVVGFWLFAPFERALFDGTQPTFRAPIYGALIWTAIAMLALAVYLLSRFQPGRWKDRLHLWVWLLPVVYLIAILPAASKANATDSFYIHIFYAVFFTLGLYLCSSPLGARIATMSWFVSGCIVVWFGMLNWFGDASFWGAINYSEVAGKVQSTYTNAVLATNDGIRLTSVFQYPDTYAAFLVALIVSALFLAARAKRWWAAGAASFIVISALVSLLLTLSRAGLLVLPVVVWLVILFLPFVRQLAVLANLIVAAIVAVVILNPLTAWGQDQFKAFSSEVYLKAFFLVLAASLIGSAAAIAVHFATRRLSSKNAGAASTFWRWLLPVVFILIGLAAVAAISAPAVIGMFPSYMQTRLHSINMNQNSVLERFTFYRDAMKLFKDYPLFGAGGDSWAVLYEKYQNNPYTSRQAHSFYVQTLVETGIVGLLVLLALLVGVFCGYIRTLVRKWSEEREDHFTLFIVSAAILIHSIIDFNMSYVYVAALVFFALGGMLAGTESRKEAADSAARIPPAFGKWNVVYASAMGVAGLLLIVLSSRLYSAHHLYQSAFDDYQSGKPLSTITGKLDRAISVQRDPDFLGLKAALLTQAYKQTQDRQYAQAAQQTLDRLKKTEPYSHQYVENQYNLAVTSHRYDEAIATLSDAVVYYPWDILMYEQSISLNAQLGLAASDAAKRKAYWDRAMTQYQEILSRVEELKHLPEGQNQGNPFAVTPDIAAGIGQILYGRQDYAQAEQVLKPFTGGNLKDAANRRIVGLYLQALAKQNKSDDALAQKLKDAGNSTK